jgi:hypothetical protein
MAKVPRSALWAGKGLQTGVDRRGRHICWDNITGFRVDCPEPGQEQNVRSRQPEPEPGEHQPMPGEDPDPQEGGPDPQAQAHAAQQAQAQRDFDRDRLTSSITEAMSCLEFIALTTRHLLDLLAQADPMEREYLKQNLVVNDSGQELALRLADAVLPGTGGEVIQMSPRDGTPRGSALDAEYLRSRVVQMQGCGAFVRDTFEGVLKETASLTPEEYQFLLQNLGIGEREFAVAETLISGALGRASEEVGQEDQKGLSDDSNMAGEDRELMEGTSPPRDPDKGDKYGWHRTHMDDVYDPDGSMEQDYGWGYGQSRRNRNFARGGAFAQEPKADYDNRPDAE